jgi:hypothetical protein
MWRENDNWSRESGMMHFISLVMRNGWMMLLWWSRIVFCKEICFFLNFYCYFIIIFKNIKNMIKNLNLQIMDKNIPKNYQETHRLVTES